MALPETFTQFARTAAEQLRWKKAQPLVEDELLTHLCDQRDALMAGGMDEAAAAAESLRLTGDPYEIGTALDRVHRPKTPKLLFALAALIALAGLAFTALVSFRDYELSYFAVHQSVALLLGTAAMLAAYFLDFTLLGRFARLFLFSGIICINRTIVPHSKTYHNDTADQYKKNCNADFCLFIAHNFFHPLLYAYLSESQWNKHNFSTVRTTF